MIHRIFGKKDNKETWLNAEEKIRKTNEEMHENYNSLFNGITSQEKETSQDNEIDKKTQYSSYCMK